MHLVQLNESHCGLRMKGVIALSCPLFVLLILVQNFILIKNHVGTCNSYLVNRYTILQKNFKITQAKMP